MVECVFCAIARGDASAQVVCEWPDSIAIVPLNPVTDSHVLVLPRAHVVHAASNPAVCGLVMQRAAEVAQEVLPCNIITSIGAEASQSIFHLHVHVIPRRAADGLHLPWTKELRANA